MVSLVLTICQFYSYIHQSEGPRPVIVSRTREGFTLNIVDTPGLVEEGYVNSRAIELIKRLALLSVSISVSVVSLSLLGYFHLVVDC